MTQEMPKQYDIPVAQPESVALYDAFGQPRKLDEVEAEIIDLFLRKYNNKVEKVSTVLGISKATIYRRIRSRKINN